jgi:hypothetical protein
VLLIAARLRPWITLGSSSGTGDILEGGGHNLVAGSSSGALTMGVDINALVTIDADHTHADNVGDALTMVVDDARAAVHNRGAMGSGGGPKHGGSVPVGEGSYILRLS